MNDEVQGDAPGDKKPSVLAYFSHSYRPEQKAINLRVWEMLSAHNMHFTVDPKGNEPHPMDITELEAMMRRSACFVAVVPYREGQRWSCSPHQLFEHALAIRANKPRLLFVEAPTPKSQFAPNISTIVPYVGGVGWFDEHQDTVQTIINSLVQQAHQSAPPSADLMSPAGIVVGNTEPYAELRESLKNLLREIGYPDPKFIDLSEFRNEYMLMSKLHECSVLISEIRPPHISLDLLGIIHGSAIPTIRICNLHNSENQHKLENLMRLGPEMSTEVIDVTARNRHRLPWIYAGYKVDDGMQPILFWQYWDELQDELSNRLNRLRQKHVKRNLDQIDSLQKARDYFLELGRLPGKVFISNASEINPFVADLIPALREMGIQYFHYRDRDKNKTSPDYEITLRNNIKDSAIFLALTNAAYMKSEPCRDELEQALKLYYQGEILIIPYLMEKGVSPPPAIGRMHAIDLYSDPEVTQRRQIVKDIVSSIEIEKRLRLDSRERDTLVRGLERLTDDAKILDAYLSSAGFPRDLYANETETLGKQPETSARQLLERLLAAARRSFDEAKALGRLILRLGRLVDTDDERETLADLVKRCRLLPDIRAHLSTEPYREVGLGYYDGKLQLFSSIENSKPMDTEEIDAPLDEQAIAELVNIAGYSEEWERWMLELGEQLGVQRTVRELHQRIRTLLRDHDLGEEDIGVCIAGEKDLVIPFEWTIEKGEKTSLCFRHPVRRLLMDVGTTRSAIRNHLLEGPSLPLRVLLVAANTGDLPEVDKEIRSLARCLEDWYAKLGWSYEDNVKILDRRQASLKKLERELSNGEYDVLHLAGHTAEEDGQQGIALPPERRHAPYVFVSADRLHSWLRKSKLRFVYLGCCHGAGPPAEGETQTIVRFDNLVQAAVKARVPEVVGFLWPVYDDQGRRFAEAFYEGFIETLRPASALHAARKAFEHDDQIIGAAVLYSQSDTASI